MDVAIASESFETPYIRLEKRGRILYSFYKKRQIIDRAIAMDIVAQRLEFTNCQPMPTIVFDEGIIAMKKGARQYLSSPEGISCLTAAAIIRSSYLAVFIGNFLIRVEKVTIPARLCQSEEEALHWISPYIYQTNLPTYDGASK
jgi:hypothetical protein